MKTAGVMLVVLLMTTGSFAMSLWDIDFENDTVGLAPAEKDTYHDGGGVYEYIPSQVIDDGGASATILVQQDWSAGGTVLPGKSAVITDTGDGTRPEIQLMGHFDDIKTPNLFQLEFDMLVADGADGTFWSVQMERLGSSTPIGIIAWNSKNNRIILNANGNKETFFDVWAPNELAHIEILMDTVNDELSVYSNGALVGSKAWTFTDHSTLPGGVRTFHLMGGATGAVVTMGIDNIKTWVVPEPATLMLLFAGAGALGLRRKK